MSEIFQNVLGKFSLYIYIGTFLEERNKYSEMKNIFAQGKQANLGPKIHVGMVCSKELLFVLCFDMYILWINLIGKEKMTTNVHLLQHLPLCMG